MTHELRLRPLALEDEAEFLAAHRVMEERDSWTFALNYDDRPAWADFVQRHEDYRRGLHLSGGLVPAHFLVADVGGVIVGRTSIRHRLNDFLEREGGHIGYGVLPDHRRKGHATEILRQSLVIARAVGIARSLLICDDHNVGSAKVIERCGGRLENVTTSADGNPIRRYWVP